MNEFLLRNDATYPDYQSYSSSTIERKLASALRTIRSGKNDYLGS